MKHRIYSFPLTAKGKPIHKQFTEEGTLSPANESRAL